MKHQFQNNFKNLRMNRRDLLKAGAAMVAAQLPVLAYCKNLTPSMEIIKHTIPGTSEQLPAIGMGTWQTFDIGNNADERENIKQVLKTFAEKGGTVIDSSPMYGRSEDVVGELAGELKIIPELFMATKVWTRGKQAGIRQMQQSMQEMRANPMDLMQVHNLVDYHTHIQTLKQWKSEGKIRYIGITHYTDSAHDDLAELIRTEDLDFIQVNYSINDRHADRRLLPLAKDRGVAVLINRPYSGGSLFSRVKGKELPDWAAAYDITSWGQFFLKFIISHPAVTCAIPATSKVHHMEDNMGAAYGKLPDEQARKEMIRYFEQ
ncbi:aldo/keto reductase [Flavilitoribacter nigricans]|uniref:Aldo/keto reductase n=1 Tax=Flavilitoribacter nigricans (strain ATCC 23147 / DSM 23189 / NBRC 102662 / NCIMB 1420 / SS-2) TaxID=1122177 RepID=A0A2D0NCW9_FLAN2|nr:aldo/keto reductase [Flavilitoribacter nigricans]PHN06216.1 aldo/keto reductase [Flavilitoribacter nigricans DSM 23189 = NBRC 102662]